MKMSSNDIVEVTEIKAEPSLPEALMQECLDPLFWPPTRAGSMSAWWGHVPFGHWIVAATRPGVIVELGTHNGVSFAAFCEAILRTNIDTRCYAVDTWQGDEHAGRYDDTVFQNLQEFIRSRYSAFAEMIRLTFDEAADYFAEGTIDLLHIDGLHTYEAVKGDFERWLPKLSEKGVVLFHDSNVHERDFGVWQLWAEVTRRYPSFEFLHSHGLGIAAVGKKVPAAIAELCRLQGDPANLFRERFAQLGARWADFDRANSLAKEVELQRALMTEYSGREKRASAQIQLLGEQINLQNRQLKGQGLLSAPGSGAMPGIDARDRLVRTLQAELAALYGSNSWRVTKPLRALQTALLRFRSRQWNLVSARPSPSSAGKPRPRSRTAGPAFPSNPLLPDRETVVVAVHEATRTGGAILAWNIAYELKKRLNVIVLLKHGGPIQSAFEEVSTGTIILNADFVVHEASIEGLVEQIIRRYSPRYVIANTVETRMFVLPFENAGIPTISLIHEFSSTARPIGSLYNLFRTASQVVFSAGIVADSALRDYRELAARVYQILPQGLCRLPTSSLEARSIVDTPVGDLTLLPPYDDSIVVVGIGTITMRKGVEFFIAAAASVRRQNPGRKVTFVWVGKCYEFEEYYLDYLKEQIDRSEVGDSFVFLGEFEDLEPIYARADLYFLSSRLDPLPNVAIDSATRGIPVICFEKASGFAEILKGTEQVSSLVVPHLDSEGAARLVIELTEDRPRLAALSEAIRAVAEEHFNMARYVESIDHIARLSVQAAQRDKTSFEVLAQGKHFNASLYLSPSLPEMSYEATLRKYIHESRLASPRGRPLTGLLVRRPLEGFHPLVYASDCPDYVESEGEDPLAHYIKARAPAGRWQHQIIRQRSERSTSRAKFRVAIHGHFHYPELLEDFMKRVRRSEFTVDLYLTTTSEDRANALSRIIADIPHQKATITVVANRGRDIGPMLTALSLDTLLEYDIVGHFHGKRSLHVDETMGASWRNFLWENLIGGEHQMIDRILDAFAEDPQLGLVFAEDPHLNDWDQNRELAEKLAIQIGRTDPLPVHFDFPIGTMFWARPQALKPLFDLGLTTEDFPLEPLPIDGTILHALERLIPFAAAQEGYRYAATYLEGWTR